MAQNIDRVVDHLLELNGLDVATSRIWPELQVILTIVDSEVEVPREQVVEIVSIVNALEAVIPQGERMRVSKWLARYDGEATDDAAN